MKRMLRWGNGRRGALVSKKRDGTSPHHLAVAAQILSGMAVGRANDGMAAQYTTPSVLAHAHPPPNRAGRGKVLTMSPSSASTPAYPGLVRSDGCGYPPRQSQRRMARLEALHARSEERRVGEEGRY